MKVKIFIQGKKLVAFNMIVNGIEHVTCDFYQSFNKNEIDIRISNITRLDFGLANQELLSNLIMVTNRHDDRIIDTEAEVIYDDGKTWGISTISIRLPSGTLD